MIFHESEDCPGMITSDDTGELRCSECLSVSSTVWCSVMCDRHAVPRAFPLSCGPDCTDDRIKPAVNRGRAISACSIRSKQSALWFGPHLRRRGRLARRATEPPDDRHGRAGRRSHRNSVTRSPSPSSSRLRSPRPCRSSARASRDQRSSGYGNRKLFTPARPSGSGPPALSLLDAASSTAAVRFSP